jgi:hypothetical protein
MWARSIFLKDGFERGARVASRMCGNFEKRGMKERREMRARTVNFFSKRGLKKVCIPDSPAEEQILKMARQLSTGSTFT